MSDQSTDPAPTTEPAPDAPEDAPVEPTSTFATSSGDLVTIQAGEDGNTEVVDVIASTAPAGDTLPSSEYGYRPDPIPGPGIAEIQLSSQGYEPQRTAQEQIMDRAQAQADGIMAAAQAQVEAMDQAEAAQNISPEYPRGAGAENTTPHTAVVEPAAETEEA